MRFCDVHHLERNLVAVLLIKLVEGRNLPPEGRSSIASEDQHHGPLAIQCRKLHRCIAIQSLQGKIRRVISDLYSSLPRLHPHGFEGKCQKRNRSRNSLHEPPKLIRWLPHLRINVRATKSPQHGKNHECRSNSHYRLRARSSHIPFGILPTANRKRSLRAAASLS
jgi:hypothetical protein